jgi:hypothetical protein
MYTTDELFADKSEWGAFHDVVYEVVGRSLSPEELRGVFEELPETTRNVAHSWGLSDTPFKDSAYTWLRDNDYKATMARREETGLAPSAALSKPPEPEVRYIEAETDWKKAFQALTILSCTGFVTSEKVSHLANRIREECGDEAAGFMIEVFNGTRSDWMQDFMG